jgi:hypothetical protein
MSGPPALVLACFLALVTAAACSPSGEIPDWRTNPDEPYPFRTPVPPLAATVLDGVYDRDPTDAFAGEWAGCRRCPPYFLDRARTTLILDRGRWQNLHHQPRQVTSGHVMVDGDRVVLVNDPICPDARGEYRFTLENGVLQLEAIDDPCAFGERERDLTARPWHRIGDASPAPRGSR